MYKIEVCTIYEKTKERLTNKKQNTHHLKKKNNTETKY